MSAEVKPGFDHAYRDYGAVLRLAVREGRVDYGRLRADRQRLDSVVTAFGAVPRDDVEHWTSEEQMAFWINAYNLFTLRVIIDHYPIEGSWFSRQPRNSIRQIDGVWTTLAWTAAGRRLTLDDIEHRILRPTFKEPRVHFAINCASMSCPPLADTPYRADTIDAQLDAAARRFLNSPFGVTVRGTRLSVSSIFKWYGEDFVERYGRGEARSGSATERAILAVVAAFGSADAKAAIESGRARLAYLAYDWSLNDIATRSTPP